MQNQESFFDDIHTLRDELERHLDQVKQERRSLHKQIMALRKRIPRAKRGLVATHVPDLMPDSVAKLRELDDGLFARSVEDYIWQVNNEIDPADMPFRYSIPVFGRWLHRRHTHPQLTSVRMQFLAYIGDLNPLPEWCKDIKEIYDAIEHHGTTRTRLSGREDALRAQLSGLGKLNVLARRNFKRLHPRTVSSIRTSAQELRWRARQDQRRLDTDDSYPSVVDLWLANQLLNSGRSGNNADHEIVTGRGGDSIGAGAEQTGFDHSDDDRRGSERVPAREEPDRSAFTTGGMVADIGSRTETEFTTGGSFGAESTDTPQDARIEDTKIDESGGSNDSPREEDPKGGGHDDSAGSSSPEPADSRDESSSPASSADSSSDGSSDSSSYESPSSSDSSGSDSPSGSSDSGSSGSSGE